MIVNVKLLRVAESLFFLDGLGSYKLTRPPVIKFTHSFPIEHKSALRSIDIQLTFRIKIAILQNPCVKTITPKKE